MMSTVRPRYRLIAPDGTVSIAWSPGAALVRALGNPIYRVLSVPAGEDPAGGELVTFDEGEE